MTENSTTSEITEIRQSQATEVPAREQIKFHQVGSYAIGNHLADLKWRSWRSNPHRKSSLTSGHRVYQGCREALGVRHTVDTASVVANNRIIAINTTGCPEVFSTPYPETAWTIPWPHSLFGSTAAATSGAAVDLCIMGKPDTRVITQGGDGGTVDIGMGCLSGMFERNDDVLYICYDNQVYMSTGVQRSDATPPTTRTVTAQPVGPHPGNVFTQGENMTRIAMMHEVPYVTIATVADPCDSEYKVEKAINFQGARYIHILVPCPLGWDSNSNLIVISARLATQTRLPPVFEAEGGEIISVTKIRHPVPVEGYLRPQRRFVHMFKGPGSKTLIAHPQAMADRSINRCGLVEMDALDEDVQHRVLQAPCDPTRRFAAARTCPAPIPAKPPSPVPSITPNSAPGAATHGSASPTPQSVPSAS